MDQEEQEAGEEILGEHRLDQIPMDIGQSIISTLETVGQSRMVDSQQVHDRGVQVVHMDGIMSDIVAIIIGLTDHVSALDSRSCHKRRKTPGVVVPTVVVSR